MSDRHRSDSPLDRHYLIRGTGEGPRAFGAMALGKVRTLVGRLRAHIPRLSLKEVPKSTSNSLQSSLAGWERSVLEQAQMYTMTGPDRIVATMDAVRHVLKHNVPGALVECGVWKGGSVLAMIRTLQNDGVTDRDVYLFDTFEGMTTPGERDISSFDPPALETWNSSAQAGTTAWDWAFDPQVFNLDAVRSLILSTGYPADRVHFVKGRVEDTLPEAAPPSIAVLRLDTDWYESTWHELVHLYPRISPGGLLIIDDYGHWDGCRTAVDRYFHDVAPAIFLSRIDYTGRIGVKAS